MHRQALIPVVLSLLAGCGGLEQDVPFVASESQEALTGKTLLGFTYGNTTGSFAVGAGQLVDTPDGLLGWSGPWVSVPLFGSRQGDALRVDIGASSTVLAYATLSWASYQAPQTGNYLLEVPSSYNIAGEVRVVSAFGQAASAAVDFEWQVLINSHPALDVTIPVAVANQTNQSQVFDTQVATPGKVGVSAPAGALITYRALLFPHGVTSATAGATIHIRRFGTQTNANPNTARPIAIAPQ